MKESILSLRTAMTSTNGAELTAVSFATAVLQYKQQGLITSLQAMPFTMNSTLQLLIIRLGDCSTPVDAPVPAYVNHGRWLARCECGNSELVDLKELLFMCCGCWNARQDHAWRPVLLPVNRKALEKMLLLRPMENRNWKPGTTMKHLREENAEGLAGRIV